MQATRERILDILKKRHHATVDDLSEELGLTPVTVRHHLDILRGEGLVEIPHALRRKAPGRPKYVYAITEEGSEHFPKRYDELASQILTELKDRHFSPEEIRDMMRRIGEKMARQVKLPSHNNFEARISAISDFLSEMGYMTHWEKSGDETYTLHVANCPYERVSCEHGEICLIDHAMIAELLGTPPRRTANAAAGDHECTYEIKRPPDS